MPTANSDPVSPTVDYGLNYHRAYYHNGYDNIEDIYTQRWRKEDVAWRIQTGHIVETFDGITGRFVLTDTLTQQVIASAAPARRQVMLATYLDNSTFRDIIGQVRAACVRAHIALVCVCMNALCMRAACMCL